MKLKPPLAVIMVLMSGALFQMSWVLWVPPGALPEEVAQYVAIARSGTDSSALSRLVPKDLTVLVPFARMHEGRIPVRSTQDVRRLRDRLSELTAPVYVPAEVAAARPSAYHRLLHRVMLRVQWLDIRWRWMLLRASGILMLAIAGALTYAALRRAWPRNPLVGVAGAALVTLGPASAWSAVTLRPTPLVAALWAGWAWAIARLWTGDRWASAWAALVALAMSAADVQGAAACGATIVAIAVARPRPWERGGRIACGIAICLGVVGVALWIVRFAHVGVPSVPLNWRGYLSGAPAEFPAVPGGLAAAWILVGACALAAALTAWPGYGRAVIPLAAGTVMAAAIAVVIPTEGVTVLCIAPLVACLAATGAARVVASPLRVAVVLAALVMMNWAALLTWVIPGLYQ